MVSVDPVLLLLWNVPVIPIYSVIGISWYVTRRLGRQRGSHGLELISRGFLVSFTSNALWAIVFWTVLGGPLLFFNLAVEGMPQSFLFLVGSFVSWADYAVVYVAFAVMMIFIVYGLSVMIEEQTSTRERTWGFHWIPRLSRMGRGLFSGVVAGVVWGGLSILGQFLFITNFHEQILAQVQSSIASPLPLLPGFPALGFTQQPNAEQLIGAYAYGIAVITLVLGLLGGGIFGLVFPLINKPPIIRGKTVLKSMAIGSILWALYSISYLLEPSPLGSVATLISLASAFCVALVSSSVLGYLNWRITPKTMVDPTSVHDETTLAGGSC